MFRRCHNESAIANGFTRERSAFPPRSVTPTWHQSQHPAPRRRRKNGLRSFCRRSYERERCYAVCHLPPLPGLAFLIRFVHPRLAPWALFCPPLRGPQRQTLRPRPVSAGAPRLLIEARLYPPLIDEVGAIRPFLFGHVFGIFSKSTNQQMNQSLLRGLPLRDVAPCRASEIPSQSHPYEESGDRNKCPKA